MFKCIGVCSKCGRCREAALMQVANERKTKILTYPESFVARTDGIGYGVAFDIGTTTVVGMMWDMNKGEQIASCAKTNPQNEFGMDVISRIMFCNSAEGNIEVLRGKIIECINEIMNDMCKKADISTEEIYDIVVCGNTTMSHIFAGYPPKTLALAPFTPAYEKTLELTTAESGLSINPNGNVTVVPNIAGHVGGDITSGILATGILDKTGITLYIDIGTNGEIVLTDGETTYACSTAAGPAFEGASIKHGMRAAEGAIESVIFEEDGEVYFQTIGLCEPQGLCGSGLIDAIAQMLKMGIITKTGKLLTAVDAEKRGIPLKLQERLIKTEYGKAFVLVSKVNGEDIVITQQDIREVQLAKGAILTGINMMLAEMDKTADDIDQLLLAGAFGNYINKDSALTISVFPDIPQDKIISVGNAAGSGVSMVLAGTGDKQVAEKIPEKVIHVDLSAKDGFQDAYLKAMSF